MTVTFPAGTSKEVQQRTEHCFKLLMGEKFSAAQRKEVITLINQGVCLEAEENGYQLLHAAIRADAIDIINLLLEKGADPQVITSLGLPIHCCKSVGTLEIFIHYNDVNALNGWGNTPLHGLVAFGIEGFFDAAKFLVEHGADLEIRNRKNEPPMGDLPKALKMAGYIKS